MQSYKKVQANQQSDATAEPFSQSHRELTRSSQYEPSSYAARQWNISTLTKSWEVTVLPRAISSLDTEHNQSESGICVIAFFVNFRNMSSTWPRD